MRIYATNPQIQDNPSVNMSAPSTVGATTLKSYTNQGFSSTTNLVLVGLYGDEQSEIVRTSTTVPLTFTLSSGTLYAHPQDTLLSLMPYDQIEFSRSDDGGNSWSVLGLIQIQTDRITTVYIDNGGNTNSLWRYRFYNSLTTIYSSYSGTLGQSGYAPYQLEKMQDRTISLFQDPNLQFLSYSDITDWINECSDMLASEIYMNDKMGLQGFISPNIAGQTVITLPNDFVKLKRILISYDGTNYVKASPNRLDSVNFAGTELTAQQQFAASSPVYYRQDNQLFFFPTASVVAYKMWYYRLPTYLVNPPDMLDLVFRPYTQIYVDYCMQRAKMKDGKNSETDRYEKAVNKGMIRFIENCTRWQLDENDFMTDPTSYETTDGLRSIGKLT